MTDENILDLTQTAERIGIRKPSVLEAVERGRLNRRADKRFDVADVDAFIAGRGHPRGGARRPRIAIRQAAPHGHLTLADALPGSPAHGVPKGILDVSTAINCGAVDLAFIAARYLPMPIVREIVAEWLAKQRCDWVGAPGCETEPMATTDDWPAPPGNLSDWSAHDLFLGTTVDGLDWQEIDDDAATWRAARAGAAA